MKNKKNKQRYFYTSRELDQIDKLNNGESLILTDHGKKFSITCIHSEKAKCNSCEFNYYSNEEACQYINCTQPYKIFVRSDINYEEKNLMTRPWLRK